MNAGTLKMGRPETADMSYEGLESAFRVVSREVERGAIAGAVAAVGRHGQIVGMRAYGWAEAYEQKRLMQVDTLFDLASLTKVMATLPSVLRLLDAGYLRLDDPVATFLPEFSGQGRELIRIRHLLTHTAGLPAHRRFWEEGLSGEQISKAAPETLPVHAIGEKVVYSDVGFILLGMVVERLSGMDLASYTKKHIYGPLGMTDTGFLPPPVLAERAAATEYRKDLNKFMIGEVHDENAYAMGGVAGHAGLFSTAADVCVFCQMLLQHGSYANARILSPASISTSTQCHTPPGQDKRGLGWLIKGGESSSAGDLLPDGTFYHTGFTGTALWIDKSHDLFIILLTNRVHPTRDNDTIVRLRPRFCNAVAASIKDWSKRDV